MSEITITPDAKDPEAFAKRMEEYENQIQERREAIERQRKLSEKAHELALLELQEKRLKGEMSNNSGGEKQETQEGEKQSIVHATDDYLPPSEAIKNRYPVKGFPIDRKLAYTFYERQIPKEKRNSPNTAYRLKELADNSAKMAELSRRLELSEFVDRGGYGVQRARNWELYRDHEKEVVKNTAILNIIPLFSEVEIHEKTRLKLGL